MSYQKKGQSYWIPFVAGNLSGICTRIICQPLDVIKIRFQLQLEDLSNSKYKNLRDAIAKIYSEEGVKAFWKGHMPAQYMSMVYGGVQFVTYETINQQLINYELNGPHPAAQQMELKTAHSKDLNKNAFISGSIAGMAATCVTFPFDLFKTRLISQYQNKKIYKGVIHGSKLLYKSEGIPGFFRGLTPSLIQIAPYSGLYFMFYGILKNTTFFTHNQSSPSSFFSHSNVAQTRNKDTNIPTAANKKNKSYLNLINGAMAGTLAKIIVYPLDTIKKRFQIQGFEKSRIHFGKFEQYLGLRDCVAKMIQNEGYSGFYKGLLPTLIKAGLSTGLMFYFYEIFFNVLRHP